MDPGAGGEASAGLCDVIAKKPLSLIGLAIASYPTL
jgi:hypothetical protein